MTDKEMKRFLKREGFQDLGAGCLNDPVTGRSFGPSFYPKAVAVASRRKASRERADLKKAGIKRVKCPHTPGCVYMMGRKFMGETRAQALASLEGR